LFFQDESEEKSSKTAERPHGADADHVPRKINDSNARQKNGSQKHACRKNFHVNTLVLVRSCDDERYPCTTKNHESNSNAQDYLRQLTVTRKIIRNASQAAIRIASLITLCWVLPAQAL
jgi:hypothetical protein